MNKCHKHGLVELTRELFDQQQRAESMAARVKELEEKNERLQDALASEGRGHANEQQQRLYYQRIVLHVCKVLDRINGISCSRGNQVACGNAGSPTTEVQDQMDKLFKEMFEYRRDRTQDEINMSQSPGGAKQSKSRTLDPEDVRDLLEAVRCYVKAETVNEATAAHSAACEILENAPLTVHEWL